MTLVYWNRRLSGLGVHLVYVCSLTTFIYFPQEHFLLLPHKSSESKNVRRGQKKRTAHQ